MGWKDFFKKKEAQGPDPLTELTLSNLQVGFFLDYDLKTWEVTGSHYYDWGSGDLTYEWQLKSHDETIYLEREPDDEDYWSISRKIAFQRLGAEIKKHILENDDPPESVVFEGTTFYREEMGGGKFFENRNSPGKELLKWDYADESGQHFLSIEQWGEEEFEASIGEPVETYQFVNILPGKSKTV
jgi:hypothetical protein